MPVYQPLIDLCTKATWLYNRTNGSILAPALFHPAMNTFGDNLPPTPIATWLFVALAVFAIVYDRMWKKLPPDHPAVYHAPTLVAEDQK